jgi:hypothetical protein
MVARASLVVVGMLVAACGGDSGTQTTTMMVGSAGGAVALGDITLNIPAGALTVDTAITITSSIDGAPMAYSRYTAVYTFEPAGLQFAQPVTVSARFDGTAALATWYWSDSSATVWTGLQTTVVGTTASAAVTHFSKGFVGMRFVSQI